MPSPSKLDVEIAARRARMHDEDDALADYRTGVDRTECKACGEPTRRPEGVCVRCDLDLHEGPAHRLELRQRDADEEWERGW